MYALSTSDEGDCYLCVPPDPGIEAAAPGAGETAALGASAYAATGSARVTQLCHVADDVSVRGPLSEGLGFESQCVHFGHSSAGGCQRSTGDPRLILGKGYRHVEVAAVELLTVDDLGSAYAGVLKFCRCGRTEVHVLLLGVDFGAERCFRNSSVSSENGLCGAPLRTEAADDDFYLASPPSVAMAARFVAILLLATLAFASANDGQNTLTSQLRSAGCSGFAKLLEQADMVTELEGKLDSGEATLFVPSDDSLMYKVSPALLAYLKAPVNKDILRKVLLFHVVPERISAFKWDGDHATLEGSPAVLRMDALAFYVSNVAVKEYNAIISKDAVVHSIRGLLIPPSLEEALGSIDFGAVDVHEDDGRRILAAPGSENSPGSDAAPAPPAPTVSPSPPATTAPPPSTTSPTPPMPSARIVAGFRWFVSVAAVAVFALVL
ncbi:unnamed protein product [Closterium sp. NIES-53]